MYEKKANGLKIRYVLPLVLTWWKFNKFSPYRDSHRGCSIKKVFLKVSQNQQVNRPQARNFIKKETLTQMFSCEFCQIFKNTFFIEHLRTASSVLNLKNYGLLKTLRKIIKKWK